MAATKQESVNGSTKPFHNKNNNNNNKNRANGRNVGGRKYYEVQALDAKSGTSKLKKKIRDMERLLRNGKFLENNAEKKQETERALEALKSQYEQAKQVNTERDIVAMYHKIRFFERKKAHKKVLGDAKMYSNYLNAQKKDESDSNMTKDEEELKAKLLDSEIELYYTILFPRAERYVSLYPSSEKPEDEKVRNKIKEAVKSEIKKLINVGDLPSGLKDPNEDTESKSEEEEEEKEEKDNDEDEKEDNDEEDKEKEKDTKETKSSQKKKTSNKPTSRAVDYCDQLRTRIVAGETFITAEIVSTIRSAHPIKPKTDNNNNSSNGDKKGDKKDNKKDNKKDHKNKNKNKSNDNSDNDNASSRDNKNGTQDNKSKKRAAPKQQNGKNSKKQKTEKKEKTDEAEKKAKKIKFDE